MWCSMNQRAARASWPAVAGRGLSEGLGRIRDMTARRPALEAATSLKSARDVAVAACRLCVYRGAQRPAKQVATRKTVLRAIGPINLMLCAPSVQLDDDLVFLGLVKPLSA